MRVWPTGVPLKPVVTGIVIELDDMEAGWLRSVMFDNSEYEHGFTEKMFQELDKYYFPNYEKAHPGWRDKRGIG